jgi:hypothetical protein
VLDNRVQGVLDAALTGFLMLCAGALIGLLLRRLRAGPRPPLPTGGME